MKTRFITLLNKRVSASLLLPLFAGLTLSSSRIPQDSSAVVTASTIRIGAPGDELAIVFPVKPAVYHYQRSYAYALNGESITDQRVATAYFNGVVYSLEILKAGNPAKALREYLSSGPRSHRDKRKRQSVTVSGKTGTQDEFRMTSIENGEPAYMIQQYFATKHNLCLISATARDESTQEMRDFFSSLKFGEPVPPGSIGTDNSSAVEKKQNETRTHFTGDVFEAKAVTRQVVIVWQPPLDLRLSEAADDLDRRRYEIQVRGVLTADGEVANIEVPYRMTEEVMALATAMTKQAKFIPAELHGKRVAQRFTFKYKLRLLG